MEHVPEDYGDAPDEHGVPPATYQALERHLPYFLRSGPRDMKLAAMRQVLQGLYPLRPLRDTHQVYRRYRESIESSYQPLHRELYTMNPSVFLVPPFLQAIRSNTEAGFRSIMTEPAPGLFVFSMLQPAFCKMLKAEVDHFRHYWTYVRNQRLMMPTTVMNRNNYGAILCDFGLETMLDNFMKDFLSPIATVLYPELGASSLDSHHSFVAGFAKDQQEGLHADESEVTLNACINEDFTGGDMYFRGVRCMNHRATPKTQIAENAVYSHTLDKLCFTVGVTGMAPFTHFLGAEFLSKCGVEAHSLGGCLNTSQIFPAGVASVGVKIIEEPGKMQCGSLHRNRRNIFGVSNKASPCALCCMLN